LPSPLARSKRMRGNSGPTRGQQQVVPRDFVKE
jgi:hypothetical protein